MKKVFILAALISLAFSSISCDNNDTNTVQYELQAIDKDKVETPTTKS